MSSQSKGKFLVIKLSLITISLTILFGFLTSDIEHNIRGGWVGDYTTGFPFVYESGGGAARTPTVDPATHKIVLEFTSNSSFSWTPYILDWFVYFCFSLVCAMVIQRFAYSRNRFTRLFSRYYIGVMVLVGFFPIWLISFGSTTTAYGYPIPFFNFVHSINSPNIVSMNWPIFGLDLILYGAAACILAYCHRKLKPATGQGLAQV